jgi:glutamyl-tRNA synthetase
LLRLGWAHRDKEIFTLAESVKLFDLKGVGKSPSKLDMSRILSLNEHYIKHIDEKELFKFLKDYCKKFKKKIDVSKENTLLKSMNFLKNKAKTLNDIYQNAQYILNNIIKISSEDLKFLDVSSKEILKDFLTEYEKMTKINKESLEKIVNVLIDKHETNFKGIGQPLRIALTGSKYGPSLYDIILSLDKSEVIKRLKLIK